MHNFLNTFNYVCWTIKFGNILTLYYVYSHITIQSAHILNASYWTKHTAHCTLEPNTRMQISHCTLHRSHWILYISHCTLHRSHCTLHRSHCTLHRSHWILYISHCTLHTAQIILQTANCTLHSSHSTLCNLIPNPHFSSHITCSTPKAGRQRIFWISVSLEVWPAGTLATQSIT